MSKFVCRSIVKNIINYKLLQIGFRIQTFLSKKVEKVRFHNKRISLVGEGESFSPKLKQSALAKMTKLWKLCVQLSSAHDDENKIAREIS